MSRTVLITGASRGIGNAAAKLFAQHGYHLILTCVSSITMLKDFARSLESEYGITCSAFQTDMSVYQDVEELFRNITDIDILINNAGISYIGLLSEMDVSTWQHIIGTNLNSCFYTSKLAIPFMLKKQEGKIINISSIWGTVGASMETAYSASKGAVNSFTKALAKELAPSNIQVNAIACGIIDTNMNSCYSAEEIRQIVEEIPADRIGTTQEVAELILQTAAAPPYMTGQIITIDGGWT